MIQWQHCQAMKFRDESKGMCCSNGKVNPEPFPPLPQQLAVLSEGTTDQSVCFLQDIRKYDSAFQFTSLGCKEVRMNGWNPQFRIQGQVCHLIGPLEPADEMQARFLQIYFMDGNQKFRGLPSPMDFVTAFCWTFKKHWIRNTNTWRRWNVHMGLQALAK